MRRFLICLIATSMMAPAGAFSQDTNAGQPQPAATVTQPPDSQAEQAAESKRYEAFGNMMRGVKLVGRFTILGKEDGPLPKEEYTIRSVRKLASGDLWLFTARIKYGNHDVTLPMPLQVKWAGETPVITLDKVTLPGLGTFSARVVLHNDKYAGTWTHDDVGGHMFGTIEKASE